MAARKEAPKSTETALRCQRSSAEKSLFKQSVQYPSSTSYHIIKLQYATEDGFSAIDRSHTFDPI